MIHEVATSTGLEIYNSGFALTVWPSSAMLAPRLPFWRGMELCMLDWTFQSTGSVVYDGVSVYKSSGVLLLVRHSSIHTPLSDSNSKGWSFHRFLHTSTLPHL